MTSASGRLDLLAGGFLLTFASCLGQTWFIALSGPSLRTDLGLSHGGFGSLYALATLASGLTLAWLGAKVDNVAPRRMALAVALGIGFACFAMAAVAHPIALLPVLFGLRLCGQGLMSHVALTTMARGFPTMRGRALSLASLGFPAGEALLPGLVAWSILALGWRSTWMLAGAVALLALPPLFARLLRDAPLAPDAASGSVARPSGLGRRKILRSARFALLLPALVVTGFVVTAVFFHQGALATAKSWPSGWFAACVPAYAVTSVAAILAAGFLVDRFGARRVLPLFTLPLAASMALLAAFADPWLALVAMALAGLTAGASNTVITASLAEIYGADQLGMVRALAAAAMILASALSPALAGVALDAGVGIDAVLVGCLALACVAGLLAAIGARR